MKIKVLMPWVVVGLILFGAPCMAAKANAADTLPSGSTDQRRTKNDEPREKSVAKTNGNLQDFDREQRLSKLNAKVEELQAKKASGAIKPSEERQLERLQETLKHKTEQSNQTLGKTNSHPKEHVEKDSTKSTRAPKGLPKRNGKRSENEY